MCQTFLAFAFGFFATANAAVLTAALVRSALEGAFGAAGEEEAQNGVYSYWNLLHGFANTCDLTDMRNGFAGGRRALVVGIDSSDGVLRVVMVMGISCVFSTQYT